METVVKLVLAALVALLVGLIDEPLFDINLAWWICALIGLVVVFGGWLIIIAYDE